MDLLTLDTKAHAQAGAVLSLEHPATGEPVGVEINLMGSDSEAFRGKKRELERARADKLRRARSRSAVDLSTTDNESCALLAACTTGWTGVEKGKKEIPFSVQAAEEIYMELPWIREQVDAFVGDRANFLPKESPKQPST